MQTDRLSYEMILEKSRQTGMTFSAVLGGAVLEETVRRIGGSEYGGSLWLKNGNILGIGQYRTKLVRNLEYEYVIPKTGSAELPEAELFAELAKGLKENVFEQNNAYGTAYFQQEAVFKKFLQIPLLARVEEMQVPISIWIYPLWENIKQPKKENISSMMFPKAEVCYFCYPAERALAEKFIEAVVKLELIRDIGNYYDIYRLLEREDIDGRKTKEQLEILCSGCRVSKEKETLERIAEYKHYAFMKKRWKAFLRSAHSREPSWEAAVERFLKFFEPIWQAVIADEVFFGDWMPKLERFL